MNYNIVRPQVPAQVRPAQFMRAPVVKANRVRAKSFKLQAKTEQGGVLGYLSEALRNLFSADKSDVDWSKTYRDFSDNATSLDKERLQLIAKSIQDIRGCTDPKASNFNGQATLDDGSCSFGEEDEQKRVSMAEYLQNVVRNVYEGNFEKSSKDQTLPKFQAWSFEGRIVSQRDIDKMLEFEKAVKTAMKDKKE